MSNTKTKRYKIIALCAFIAVFIGLLIFLFSGENFNVLKEIFNTNATKEEVQQAIGKLGIRSYIVVGILSMLQVVFTFIPAEPLHVISGISFGLWKGITVCLIGIFLGNTIIYVLYKIYGKKLTQFFETEAEFDFNLAKSSKKLALIVIILYCLPAIPYGIICFFAVSMGMKYHKYALITVVGAIPSLILDVGLGHITMATSWVVSIAVFIVILILLILMFKYKSQIFAKVNEFVKKSQEKQKNKVGNYNPVIYHTATTLLYAGIRTKVKIKLKNNVGKLKKPCIVLCSHGSFYDFIYSGKMIKYEKPHFIVARMYFHHKLLGKIISSTGAFPKSMFSTDVDNVKNCLKVINNNEVLAMMPEARLSTVGKFEGIQDATYKFLQKMNVTVYAIRIQGSYLANPKWGDKIRKGAKVEAELSPLFEEGELANLSTDAIKEKVESAIYYDDWQWLENNPEVHYNHKTLAEGLENILCVCPTCGAKYSLKTDKNTITCEHCDLHVTLDDRYGLSGVKFENIAKWYEWQTNVFESEILSDENYVLESKVELRHLSTDGKSCTRPSGEGICKLSREGLRYIGTEDGKEIDKLFSMDNIYRLLFGAGEDFEIYEGKELYYFVPENKRSSVAWYIVSGLLKDKEEN